METREKGREVGMESKSKRAGRGRRGAREGLVR